MRTGERKRNRVYIATVLLLSGVLCFSCCIGLAPSRSDERSFNFPAQHEWLLASVSRVMVSPCFDDGGANDRECGMQNIFGS